MAIRKSKRMLAAVLAVIMAPFAFGKPASSQLVLSCYTLHNDLVNFDRRANIARNYFMPELEPARKAAERAYLPASGTYCEYAPTADCMPEPREKITRYHQLKDEYLLSHLGGADPIRLRIIHEMQKLRCPLSDDVILLLELLEAEEGIYRDLPLRRDHRNSVKRPPLK